MDFYRRVVRGRLSEIAGEEGLPVDRLMRTLGIRRAAEREAASLDPELRGAAGALLRRRQRRRGRAPGRCPSRCSCCASSFEPWRPVDILSLGKLLAFGLSTNWERELLRADMVRALGPELTARLDPDLPGRQPDRHPGSLVAATAWRSSSRSTRCGARWASPAEASGSNNWAVSGERSAPPARR